MALTGEETIYDLALGHVGEYQITEGQTTQKQYVLCQRFYDQARDIALKSHPWNEAKVRSIVVQDQYGPLFGYDKQYSLPSDYLRMLAVNDSFGADPRNRADGVFQWEVEDAKLLSDAGETPQTWATGTQYLDGEFVASTAVSWATSTAYVVSQYVQTNGLVYQVLANHTSSSISADVTAGNLAAGIQGSVGSYEVLVTHISDTILNDIASGNITAVGSEARVVFIEYISQLTDTTKYSENLKDVIAQKLAIFVVTPLTNDTKGKVNLINQFEQLTMPQARSVDSTERTPRQLFNSSWIRSRSSGTMGWQ
jgi:hypothetical protein